MNPHPGRLVLLGHPVAHSRSPAMQNAALRSAGIPLEYESLDVDHATLATTLTELRRVRGAGNVTIPHKSAVLDLAGRPSALARRVGAANVFWYDDSLTLCVDNTDVDGFWALWREVHLDESFAGTVLINGAGGGAAAAVVAVLDRTRGSVVIRARAARRADQLVARFGVRARPVRWTEGIPAAEVLVNATPLGLSGESGPLPLRDIDPATRVIDLVYGRSATPWVREARERGLQAVDGTEMLVEQGARAFELWFSRQADRGLMRAALAG